MSIQPSGLLAKPVTRITVMQGQALVSAGPRVELTTVLGSCVATCLFDPEVELGGMNHFLLAEPPAAQKAMDRALRHAVYEVGIALPDAVRAASTTPADLIGRPDLGRIATGARADLVVLDDALRVARVMRRGSWLPQG